jgi:hypothetical protein
MRRPLILAAGLLAAAPLAIALLMLRADPQATDLEPAAVTATIAVQTADADGVEVAATLERLDDTGAAVGLMLDTHTVDLDVDLPAAAHLVVDGVAWPTRGWDGDDAGGHHRAGTLRFDPAAAPTGGEVRLHLDGLPAPVTFSWDLEGSP